MTWLTAWRRLISQLEYYPNAGLLEDEPDLTPKPPVEPSLGIDKLNTVLTELKKENAVVPESGTTVLFTNALSDRYDLRSATALKSGKSLRVALLMSDHIRRWFSASTT